MNDKQKLLIVDDRRENLVALREVLKALDVEVVEATSGDEALRATLNNDFAMAILDIMMPQMNGYELAGHLRSDENTSVMPIVFLTASFPDEQSEFKGYEAGAIDYIVKPFAPEVLLGKVKVFLELDHHKRELKRHRDHLEAMVAERMMQLRKRMQETKCLYAVSDAIAEANASIDETLGRVVEILPFGWQYPEKICAKVVYGGKEFFARNYQQTPWRIGADIVISDKRVGSVEVCYLEETISRDDGPFLHEERELVVDIARQLSLMIHREQAVEALRESEERYRLLFEGSPQGILVMDVISGDFLYANRTLCEMLGYSADEIKTLNSPEIHPIKSPIQQVYRFDNQSPEDKRLNSGIPCKKKDGTVFYADITTTVAMIDGKMRNILFFLDITERRQLEDQLRQAQKLDAIGQLAGGVAHDFNNQLAAILGYTELLGKRIVADEKSSRYLSMISTTVTRSADLSRQLLAFARKSDHQNIPVNVHDLILEVIEMLKRTIDPRVEIRTDFCRDDVIVSGDPSLLQNAFLNICINARDAMPDGGTLSIVTKVREGLTGQSSSSSLMVHFSDTGTGISDSIKEKIFDPFFTTKEVGKGTGMGLAAVYGTVTSHSGTITVDSEIGLGTAFTIHLPIDCAGGKKDDFAANKSVIRGKGNILLADDEESVREMTREMAESLGYSVLCSCVDGEEAVRFYRDHSGEIDLVIMDMIMPKKNGRDAFMEIRNINKDVLGLVVSGYGDGYTNEDFTSMGFAGVLSKPFTYSTLSHSIGSVLHCMSNSAQGHDLHSLDK